MVRDVAAARAMLAAADGPVALTIRGWHSQQPLRQLARAKPWMALEEPWHPDLRVPLLGGQCVV